jgi:RimJ/RimL family protein N-acetyltransferase
MRALAMPEIVGRDSRRVYFVSVTHFFAPERFEGPGFVLRSYDAGDGPLLAEAANESYEHLRPWMPWAKPQQSVDESEKIVRAARARYLVSEDFTLGIFSSDETHLLGGTGFHLREGSLDGKCAEIGMFVRQSEAGRGLGAKVLLGLLEWGFTEWPWLRLSWRCDANNAASIRVAEKCGLLHEGILRGQAAHVGDGRRDTTCYALTKPDWLAR